MVSKPKRKLNFETVWLREYVQTYPLSDTAFAFSPANLLTENVWLIDIMHGLRTGKVVHSEKLDEPGAHWLVRAEDCDGFSFEMMLHVETSTHHVEVLYVERLSEKNGGENAA